MVVFNQGTGQPSPSPYSSPSVMMLSRHGEYTLLSDFRRVNQRLLSDPHRPLPSIREIQENSGSEMIFADFDVTHGFFNIEMADKDRGKTNNKGQNNYSRALLSFAN